MMMNVSNKIQQVSKSSNQLQTRRRRERAPVSLRDPRDVLLSIAPAEQKEIKQFYFGLRGFHFCFCCPCIPRSKKSEERLFGKDHQQKRERNYQDIFKRIMLLNQLHAYSMSFRDRKLEGDLQAEVGRRNKRVLRYFVLTRAVVSGCLAYHSTTDRGLSGITDDSYFMLYHTLSAFLFLMQWYIARHFRKMILARFQVFTFLCNVVNTICTSLLIRHISSNIGAEFCENPEMAGDDFGQKWKQMSIGLGEQEWEVLFLLMCAMFIYRLRMVYFLYIWTANMSVLWLYSFPGLNCKHHWWRIFLVGVGLGIFSAIFETFQRVNYLCSVAAWEERKLSDRVLENVLPIPIIQELLKTPDRSKIVKSHDSVTILFSHLTGFTLMAGRLKPEELVRMLDDLFNEFDKLADTHRLEKIKTIGPTYMVAGGVPIERPNHVQDVAGMALGIVNLLKTGKVVDPIEGNILKARVGMHTGPATAGIIGTKKFAYDLWGDAVNTASRMETSAQPMRVHCSSAVYKALHHRFTFEDDGKMLIKGKGYLHTYYLLAQREVVNTSLSAP